MQSFEQKYSDGREHRVLAGGELEHVKDTGERVARIITDMYRSGASHEETLTAVGESVEEALKSIDHQTKH